jgi:adenylate kinase family enzyme
MPEQFDSMSEMERVVVIGSSCVGKTTFAQALASVLGCPHVELDALYWQPNWIARPPDEFRGLVAKEVSHDCWVADGNYSGERDLIWSRATTVIWLNYAFPVVLWRALMRTIRVSHAEELFSGNRESLRMAFPAASRFCGGLYNLPSASHALSPVV